MKKSKKKLIYDDGGIIPNVDSPEYQAYMSWLKTESLKNPITPLNPQDQSNYDRYLESIPQDESNIFNNYDPKTPIVSTSYKTPIEPIRPKLLDLSKLPTKQPAPIDTTPLGIEPKKNKDLSPYIMGGVDLLSLGIDRISQEKQAEQERQYRTQFFKPNTFNSNRGSNRNNANLSVNDTAITAMGAELGNNVNVEYEGGEQLRLPDGTEFEAIGPKHSEGGIKKELPEGTKILSDRLKPAKLADHKLLSDFFNLKVNKKDTYADLDRKVGNKFSFKKNAEITENSRYDKLSQNTASLMLDNGNKAKDALFEIQQLHNGDSNGERKMPDGGVAKDPNKIPEYRTSNYNDYVNRKQAYNDSLSLYNKYNSGNIEYNKFAADLGLKTWKDTNAYIPGAKIQPVSSQGFYFPGDGDTDGDGVSNFIKRKDNKEIPLPNDLYKKVFTTGTNSNLHEYKKPTQPVNFVPDPKIVEKQKLIGVTPDGIWGPKSEQAWQEYNNTQTITPVTQNKTTPVAPTEKPKTQGYFKLNGREFPYSSEEELEQLKQSMSKYGKFANIGGQKNAYNFNGTGFKGWNDKGELIDKDGKVVFAPKQKFAMGGQVKYEVGQEYDLSKEEILELKRLGYKLK